MTDQEFREQLLHELRLLRESVCEQLKAIMWANAKVGGA